MKIFVYAFAIVLGFTVAAALLAYAVTKFQW